jgi:hypothetical protein
VLSVIGAACVFMPTIRRFASVILRTIIHHLIVAGLQQQQRGGDFIGLTDNVAAGMNAFAKATNRG